MQAGFARATARIRGTGRGWPNWLAFQDDCPYSTRCAAGPVLKGAEELAQAATEKRRLTLRTRRPAWIHPATPQAGPVL